MANYLEGKTVVITGAAGGFGLLVSQKVAKMGANVVAADVKEAELADSVATINDEGGNAISVVTDVTDRAQMKSLAEEAIRKFERIDIMLNNAGIMPLAFFADHEAAAEAWERCIDINLKGVLNGIAAVHDQMIKQGQGHIVNVSSIYGNYPVVGAAVYGATKAAVNFMSESLRQESLGKIKVTNIKPTGIPATGLATGIVNQGAIAGILGANLENYITKIMGYFSGQLSAEEMDPENIAYFAMDPAILADQIVWAMNQPWGVSLSDITVRASGDNFVI